MRRIAVAFAATVSVVVLLFSYHTSSGSGAGPLAVSGPAPLSRPATTSAPSASGTPSTTPSTSGGGNGTFTGNATDTQYGPVQVQITVSAGKITAVQALQVPQESGRDIRINSEAVPILNSEAMQAQSAQIDTVSGATYTSEGYVQSLQSALDAAHR